MYAARYFAPRYYAERYWPSVGAEIVAPDAEGIEWTLPDGRLHFTMDDGRLHYTLDTEGSG